MSGFEGLPDKRTSLVGTTGEGAEAWLIRSISQKLYRCPACHGEIEIGAEHVVVQFVHRIGGTEHHHWHHRCVEDDLFAELRGLRKMPAAETERGKLEATRPQAGRAAAAPALSFKTPRAEG